MFSIIRGWERCDNRKRVPRSRDVDAALPCGRNFDETHFVSHRFSFTARVPFDFSLKNKTKTSLLFIFARFIGTKKNVDTKKKTSRMQRCHIGKLSGFRDGQPSSHDATLPNATKLKTLLSILFECFTLGFSFFSVGRVTMRSWRS